MKTGTPLADKDRRHTEFQYNGKRLMKELDLRGVGLPLSLLQCKNSLLTTKPNEEMEVLVRDPEVMEDLVKIIRRSHERPARTRREGDYYRIHIGPNHSGPS